MTTPYKPLLTRGMAGGVVRCALTRTISRATKGLAAALIACAGVATPAFADTAAARFAEGLLWRVEAPGAPPSWVYGTLHVSDERTARLPGGVERLMPQLAIVATEITYERRDLAQINLRVFLPEGERLSDRLAAGEFAALAAMLGQQGLAASSVDRLTPLGAIAMLVARPHPSRTSLDMQVFRAAKANRLKTVGLETVDEQFDVIARTGDEPMLADLRVAAREPKRFHQGIDELVQHYAAERIGELAARIGRERSGATGERFIEKRNHVMLARARPLLESGGVLIAVGAAHLGGPEGLLALLERAGYTVSRARLD